MFNGFILDLDGTVYLGEKLIPGADRVISRIRSKGRKVIFISNKPLQTREDYAKKLTSLGIPANPDEIINSNFLMSRYLQKNLPGAKIFVIGESPFIEELKMDGFKITEDPKEIQYVVVAFDRTFDYQKLNIACKAIINGAHFVATNPDRSCPFREKIPDCSTIIATIEAVTQKKVETLIGKTSPFIIQAALEKMSLNPFECIIIGDCLETDIRIGKEAGIATGIVLTGVTDEETLKKYKHSVLQPDFVFKSIAEVENLLI